MTPLEQLFRHEVEFHRLLREASEPHGAGATHTSFALQNGYEMLIRAARAAGLVTGGWAPKGWETEDGPDPTLAEFGLVECPKKGYPARTEANARDSDATIWFGSTDSAGCRATFAACRRHAKPVLVVEEGKTRPSDVLTWLEAHQVETLNVAGNRESKSPGLGTRVEAFLGRVFREEG